MQNWFANLIQLKKITFTFVIALSKLVKKSFQVVTILNYLGPYCTVRSLRQVSFWSLLFIDDHCSFNCYHIPPSRVTTVRLSTASQWSSSAYGGWLHGGMAGWKLEPTMIIGFRSTTGAKFVFFRLMLKKLPPEKHFLLGSSSSTAMLKAGNTCNKHVYLNNFIGDYLRPKYYWDTVRIHLYPS